jgi:hypothetical protein
MWRLSPTSSYSYPRVTMIRIDGEICYTWHVCFPRQSTYATRMLSAGGPRIWQPFTLTQQSWTDSLLPRKSAPDSTFQPGWVAHGTLLSLSPKHNHWISVLKINIYWWTCYIDLLGPYHQHLISTFNTCSQGPTHWFLTDTGGGYNLKGAGLPHHTLQPSQPAVSTFHLRASSVSSLTKFYKLN